MAWKAFLRAIIMQRQTETLWCQVTMLYNSVYVEYTAERNVKLRDSKAKVIY
jgi:hypothetical protein